MKFELKDEYIEEVFEILCEIPYEETTMYDTEPPTERHPGIEQLISQLFTVFDCENIRLMR